MKKLSIIPLLVAGLALGGCSAETTEPESVEAEDVVETVVEEEPEETVVEEPEPTVVETFNVGELIELPSANFTVRVIEERDEIPTTWAEMTPDFIAQEGKRLWFFDIEWTNNTNEAVAKECHGPDMFSLSVYSIDGVEMLMVDQPGMIEGQECSTGLMKGETGTWMTAFTGPDADFGWAVFTDYAGGEAVVVLDPELVLYEE